MFAHFLASLHNVLHRCDELGRPSSSIYDYIPTWYHEFIYNMQYFLAFFFSIDFLSQSFLFLLLLLLCHFNHDFPMSIYLLATFFLRCFRLPLNLFVNTHFYAHELFFGGNNKRYIFNTFVLYPREMQTRSYLLFWFFFLSLPNTLSKIPNILPLTLTWSGFHIYFFNSLSLSLLLCHSFQAALILSKAEYMKIKLTALIFREWIAWSTEQKLLESNYYSTL